jgi:inner membrane protein
MLISDQGAVSTMMFITHLSFALLIGLLMISQIALPVNQLVFLAILVFASLLPDIDSAESFLGSKVRVLSLVFKHRGVIHSIFTMMIFGIMLIIITPNLHYLLAFVIGYLSHLMLDSLTPKGIPLFWPAKKRLNGSIRTTGLVDWLLLLFFVVIDVLLLLGMPFIS